MGQVSDIDNAMRWGGCSLAVAVRYVRRTDSERDQTSFEGGPLSNPGSLQ